MQTNLALSVSLTLHAVPVVPTLQPELGSDVMLWRQICRCRLICMPASP